MPSPKPVSRYTPQKKHAREEYSKVPTKTKADDPGRYTKTPHEYGDVLISGGKLGGPLMRDLLYWIERHTWGNPKRPEFAKLSLTQLARLCQSWDGKKLRAVERKSVAVALAYMERHGIIEARERKGCSANTAKMYKLTPEKWKAAPPYSPPTAKEIEQAELEAETEAEDLSPEAEAPQSPETHAADGKMSRPQPVSFRPSRGAEPVTVRLVYNPNGFGHAVSCRARAGANGRIQITFAPHKPSETKAKDCSRGQLHGSAVCSPVTSPVTEDSKLFTQYSDSVTKFCAHTWGMQADSELISAVFAASNGAPVRYFGYRVVRKFKRGAGSHTPGLLIRLAADAFKDWQADPIEARQPSEAADATQPTALSDAEVEELLRRDAELDRKAKR